MGTARGGSPGGSPAPGGRGARRLAAALLLGLGLASGAAAAPAPRDEPGADRLTGRDIYARVLDNRLDSFVQEASLASGDSAGRIQETRMRVQFKDFRDAEHRPVRGVVSKTLIKYTYPFDLRYSGYLVIQNHDRIDDQFLYFPARRQTRRVNLRGEAIFGTDFSFEDVLPRELEDATYERRPDETLDGARVYVVDADPTDSFDSEYSRFRFYVDPRSFVPLRTRYWDAGGLEVKELRTDRDSIRRFGDVWVPMRTTMRNLVLESYTTLRITDLVPDPPLDETAFDLRRLESH